MVRYILFSLLQLLSGVSIPLHTVRYGRMKVPVVLHYQMESDTSSLAVAPNWRLRIGEDSFGMSPQQEMPVCMEDDAGNRIELSPAGIFWPRGAVQFSVSDGRVKVITVLDADSTVVGRISFEAEPELKAVRISGRDSTDVQQLTMQYMASSILHSISRLGGGSVEFDFVPEAGRMLKRSVCRKDAEGRVTGASEFTYSFDSLCHYITETVTDGETVVRKTVRSFADGQIQKKEEYTCDEHLKRSTSYQYIDTEKETLLKSVLAISYPEDNLASPCTKTHNYKYAKGQPFPYPIEVETVDSKGTRERLAFSYPFCPSPYYGSVADSLLTRGMAAAVLSVSRWKDGVFLDSTSVVYDSFKAVNAPSGSVFRPSAIVYSDGENRQDTCLRYTAYDTLGLRTSRATIIHKRSVDKLPPKVFRFRASNPMADLEREQRSYVVCAAWPEITPNQEFGESYLFEGTGAYLGKVETGEPAGRVIADMGFGEEPLSAYFADPDVTPWLIDHYSTLEVVSADETAATLAKAGAFERGNQGFFRGIGYLWRESHFNCRLDFATIAEYDVYPNILYVTKAGPLGAIVHDNYNFGNYLWGATACEVGVPQWIALLGSHIHAFFSPFSFGSFDSRDDILSIRAGYHWDGRR